MRKALIVDLDDTLYNWMDAFASSFKEEVYFLCQSTGNTMENILNDFKTIFKKYNSVEVPNAVKQLAFWSNSSFDKHTVERISSESFEIFIAAWKKNIKLFSNVRDILDLAHKSGFLIFAYSDAFAFWIDFRLSILNIHNYFDMIFAMTDDQISDSEIVAKSQRQCPITSIKPFDMKPNTTVLERILIEYKIKKENAFFVGDSISKDIYAAKQIGIIGIWARYGLNYKRESGHLLSLVTPWKKGIGGKNEIRKKSLPSYTIHSFNELKSILGIEG